MANLTKEVYTVWLPDGSIAKTPDGDPMHDVGNLMLLQWLRHHPGLNYSEYVKVERRTVPLPSPIPPVRLPTVNYDMADLMVNHGHNAKNLVVLHETVSYDTPGLADVTGVAGYLHTEGYAIHNIVDSEGNSGYCYDPTAIYWHAAGGDVNLRGIGIEQVSWPHNDASYYLKRMTQYNKVAQWLAYYNKAYGIPLVYDPTCQAGVTTHFDVTNHYGVYGGHTDCNPSYYPVKTVVNLAKLYRKTGWR